MHGLPLRLRQLIGLAAIALVLVLSATVAELWNTADWSRPLLLVIPIALLDLLRVELFPYAKGDHTAFTLGSLGLFLLASLYGPSWAVLAAVLQMLLPAFRVQSPWYKTLYNTGFTTAAVWAATHLVALALTLQPVWLQAAVIPLAVAVYVLLNSSSVALAVSLTSNRSFVGTWRSHFAWVAFQELVLSLTGVALGRAVLEMGWTALLLGSTLVLLRLAYQNYVRAQAEHTQELEKFANQLIATLASLVDARDSYTFGHATMVAKYATAMGEQMGYTPEQLERLRVGALLHDIGKVGVPEAILFKPGKLEPWEYELMKEHAMIGYRIVSQIDRLRYPADIIHQHHEWWNGRGYPRGLKGYQILQDARIVGVADALESMMSDRPYRQGCSLAEAMAEIERWSGTQFDPTVVRALAQVVEQKGAGFFVNSATLVEEANGGIMPASRFRHMASTTAAPSAQTGRIG